MYSVISVNVSVDSGMRVLNPQKSPDFLLVRVVVPLGCNVAKQICSFSKARISFVDLSKVVLKISG
jgi:hypothetical protein